MTSVGRAGSQSSASDARWKWVPFALVVLLVADAVAVAIDGVGLGGTQYYGFYDASQLSVPGVPYTFSYQGVAPGGASQRAGIRDGDLLDMREQNFATRVFALAQPVTTVPLVLVMRRGDERLTTNFTASPPGGNGLKIATVIIPLVICLWCLGCVLLIAVRRSSSVEGRVLAIVLTAVGVGTSQVPDLSFPNPVVDLIVWSATWGLWLGSLGLLIWLSSRVGDRSTLRTVLEALGYAASMALIVAVGLSVFGAVSLRVDPVMFSWSNPAMGNAAIGVSLLVVTIAVTAIARSPRFERARVAWLVLPIPLAIAASQVMQFIQFFAQTWLENISCYLISQAFLLIGAFFVTYALLRRRVLDSGFLLSRTLVFGIVSLIVVAAFVLLEWLLGLTFAGASHATGLIANALLALVLGISLNFIHRRVDSFVDAVFFRKRYDDERALREFSREAAFVTEREVLLDQAVDKVRTHTDARNAALFVRETGSYKAARTFGDMPAEVGENDPAILALKARHQPVDPHPYATEMRGDLAVPLVARGHLIGVLLFGERASGEAYAPDEIEALSEFAHGVGSALDGLGDGTRGARSDGVLGSIDSRLASIERLLKDGRA